VGNEYVVGSGSLEGKDRGGGEDRGREWMRRSKKSN
jgi:hypothetical protein